MNVLRLPALIGLLGFASFFSFACTTTSARKASPDPIATVAPAASTKVPPPATPATTVRFSECVADPSASTAWKPTEQDLRTALTLAKVGGCSTLTREDCAKAVDVSRAVDAVMACVDQAKSTNVSLEIDPASTFKLGSGCESPPTSCYVTMSAIEHGGRHWLFLRASAIADYSVDVFEVKENRIVPYYTNGMPYLHETCAESEDGAVHTTVAKGEKGFNIVSPAMKADWPRLPALVREAICWGKFDASTPPAKAKKKRASR